MMLNPKPISVRLHPEKYWLPTLQKVVTDYCGALEFPQVLEKRILLSTQQVCTQLVHLSNQVKVDEMFMLSLSFHDDALIVEVTYNKKVPLDPSEKKEAADPVKEGGHVEMHSLWLKLVKKNMDRVFFRIEGDRRLLEMRSYKRSDDQAGRHWLMGLTARIKDQVKIDIHKDENGKAVSSVLHNLQSGRVLKMDAGGTFVIERLDGINTFYDIYMAFIDKIALTSPERLTMIFVALEDAGMLVRDETTKETKGLFRQLSSASNKLAFRSLDFPHGDHLVDSLYGHVRWLFHPFVTVLIVLFALSGFIPLSMEIKQVHHFFSHTVLAIHSNPLILAELYLLIILLAVFHELAHALTCRHFGGSVHRIGIMFYLALIIFFADVSAAWGFRSKWKRMAVAAAGPIFNLVLMSFCFWVWYFHKNYVQAEHSIWFLLGFFCLYLTIINLIPFIKMDGYYILTDLTGIPTLREKSFAYLKQRFFGLIRMEYHGKKIQPKGKEKWILWSYGFWGIAFTALIFICPFVEFLYYMYSDHSSKAVVIFLGIIAAFTLYNAVYKAYQEAHSRLYRKIVVQ